MTDIIQDVRDYFTDRFSSPLWLSIIVSWLLINWRLPITAIFESDRFNVSYINFYIDGTNHWCLITLPALIGLAYSIFSSSAKETLELSSKAIRSTIVKLDRSGKWYKSISMDLHNSEIDRLKRRLQKIESEKEQLAELSNENTRLLEEVSQLKSSITEKDIAIQKLSNANEALKEKPPQSIKNTDNKEKIEKIEKITSEDFVKTFENALKDQASPARTGYFLEKIIETMPESTIEIINDPSSKASLLLTLSLLNNNGVYTIEEVVMHSGMMHINKSIQTLLKAELLTNRNGKPIIAEPGIQKLKELKSEASLAYLAEKFKLIDEKTADEVVKLLQDKALDLENIKKSIEFNPNLKAIIDKLISKNLIHKKGTIYFHSP